MDFGIVDEAAVPWTVAVSLVAEVVHHGTEMFAEMVAPLPLLHEDGVVVVLAQMEGAGEGDDLGKVDLCEG